MKKLILQAIITFGIIIFFLIILYQIYVLSMEGLAEEYTERQLALTKQAASGIQSYFDNLREIMNLIASVPEVKEQKLKERHFEQIIYSSFESLEKQGIKNILILGRNSICIWQAKGENFLNRDFSATEPFKISKSLKPSQFYISDLTEKGISPLATVKEIVFGIPLYKSFPSKGSRLFTEDFSGCILLLINSDYIFKKYVAPLAQGEKETVWVTDQKGTLLYLPEHPEMVFRNIFYKNESCLSCHGNFDSVKQMIKVTKFIGRHKIDHSTKLVAATGFKFGQQGSGWVIATSSPFGKVTLSARKSYLYILILTFSIILVLITSSAYAIRINKKRAEALEEKVRASEEIRYLKEYNENIVRSIPIGVVVIDKERKITSLNEEIINQMRKVGVELNRSEEIGKDILQQMPERLKEASRKIYDQVLSEGITYEHPNITYDGKKGRFIYSVKISPFRDLKNKIVGAIITREDVTHKRALEQEIRETRDYLESIFEASVDGIIVTDAKGVITKANDAILRLLGYSREELIGKHSMELSTMLPEHLEAQRQMLAILREKGIASPTEIVYKKKDGSSLPVEQTAAFLKDKKGNLTGAVAIIRDLTEKKKAEEKQRQLQHQLIQAEKMASIGRLAGGLAHEINNPLSGVVTNLELVKELKFMDMSKILNHCKMINPGSECTARMEEFYNDFLKIEEKRRRWLDTAYKGGIRCKKIIKELLVFSRPSDQKEEKEVDLNECIEDTIDIVGYQFEIKNIKIDKELNPEIQKIWANKREIEQIFLNLFINASHAIGEGGGLIKVKTESENDFVIAKVSDTGCGIPEENIDKIFDPFFTTKEVGEGTGLGLAIIYEIVEKHGGKIEVKSKVNVGTEFTIHFPIYKSTG